MATFEIDTLAERYAAPVPRYTSYPTAPHFNGSVGLAQTAEWIAALPADTALSLYVHIPFCRALCWYCGCATTVANCQSPITAYLGSLEREIRRVAELVPARHRVTHIHWGGGSPNALLPEEALALAERMQSSFDVAPEAEFAVEIDPRYMDRERAQAYRHAGVNRVSIGVQDFDPAVQRAINRHQPYRLTAEVVAMLREAGIGSLNIDLVYGLPGQTVRSVARTVDQVLSLDPDRVAVFGYAHLPERIRHQRLIDANALAGPADRLRQAERISDTLIERGYVRVGLDHFAKPADALVTAPVSRNFQGYTTDAADALIGLGASAISRFPQGYTQNAARTPDYEKLVAAQGLATVRGLVLSAEDRIRGYVIERLMCDFSFSADDLAARFGLAAQPLIEDAKLLCARDRDGLVEPVAEGFRVSERGRPFVRSICAAFDGYLGRSTARHAQGV